MVAQAHEFYLRVLVLQVSLMSEPSERVRDILSAPIPSHVTDKNSIFTAGDEDLILQ